MTRTSKQAVIVPALLLFVLLPLSFLIMRSGLDAIRTVDFVTIFAAGTAFGAALATLIAGRAR